LAHGFGKKPRNTTTVFLRFLPVPGAKSIGVSSDKQLISVSFVTV
jgi:hypothetical protein